MTNFGYETKGGSSTATINYLEGTKFTCLDNGQANSITVYLKQYTTYTPKIKYAIYADSGGYPSTLVGYTEEWTLTNAWDNWKTLNIINGGSLTANTVYWLVLWSSNYVTFYYTTGDANQRTWKGATYNGFPDSYPGGGSQSATKASYYCTYTAGGGAAAPVKRRLLVRVGLQAKIWNLNKWVREGQTGKLDSPRKFSGNATNPPQFPRPLTRFTLNSLVKHDSFKLSDVIQH